MGNRRKPEEVIGKLREAEIVLGQDGTTEECVSSDHAPPGV
jgi:hypothetical protein